MTNQNNNTLEIQHFAQNDEFQTGRLIGLDLGTITIGIAVTDLSQKVGSAVCVLQRKKFGSDADHLVEMAAQEKALAFVIGLPLNMDGSEGPRAQATRAFVRNMAQKTKVPFIFWDERLSTVSAERALLEADMSRAKRAKKIDATAASVILQGALDRINNIRQERLDD